VVLFHAASAAPEGLGVFLDGDYLRVAVPHLDFLKGKPLDRLKDGASVAFVGQVTITTSPNSLSPAARSVAAQATELWCLDNLVIDRGLIPADKQFYVQLDLRAEDPKDQLGIIGDSGVNLTRLIEYLGRPPRSPQGRWLFNSGPFRLEDLKKTEVKAVRG
jgi:hypothetical protein